MRRHNRDSEKERMRYMGDHVEVGTPEDVPLLVMVNGQEVARFTKDGYQSPTIADLQERIDTLEKAVDQLTRRPGV